MSWKSQLRSDSLPWLLESENPGVHYLALRDLFDLSPDDKNLKTARKLAHKEGPIAHVLSKMDEYGYWVKAGPGYNPKYRSTVWAMILLAQLGASASEDKRIEKACNYVLDHMCAGGQFTTTTSGAPSGTIDCLQGNLCWLLMEMGYDDPRLDKAYEWMARTVTGDGIAPLEDNHAPVRYYVYKCGPTFACGVNNKLPCAWGGVKVMLALSQLPAQKRTPLVKKAIQQAWISSLALILLQQNIQRGPAQNPAATGGSLASPCFTSRTCYSLLKLLSIWDMATINAWRIRSISSAKSKMSMVNG